ncbi:D-alanyl-D-alanine carboxypeptidase family protein [Sphingoaurantiacus capsulatus]|uniref:serine-type D-Ala-D-Ala carboxypeptidase n=1 Tax=Sphingoaurantiacus capsulatus TaxID=1771310 RepID=A0ABV7XBY4_9SPHN
MRQFARLPLLALLVAAVPAVAQPTHQTVAPFAYMKDLSSGQVLYSKGADQRIPPASMGKMMTVYVVFDLIKKGEVKLDQKIRVRPETWQQWHGPKAGSTMFLSANEEVSVEDLLHGIVTLSGNDACVVLAEGLAGTEPAFAQMMNQVAKRIGLKGSNFANSNGWPDDMEYVTARDLAVIGERTILDFPNLYKKFYGQPSFTWGKTLGSGAPITQGNRNPILGRVRGADGLKTGHTEAAGYGFTGSAVQDGRRLVMVLGGLNSMNERVKESVAFMEWGFGAWKAQPLAKAGTVIETAEVHLGDKATVGLTAPRDYSMTVPRLGGGEVKVKVVYNGPIRAPIAKGQRVAELQVSRPGMPTATLPLVAAEAVGEAGPFGRLSSNFRNLFFGN